MRTFFVSLLVAALPAWSGIASSPRDLAGSRLTSASSSSGTVIVTGQTVGATAFIAKIQMTVNPPDSLLRIGFTISPTPGSVSRPVSATCSSDYLQQRGYLDITTGQMTLPVFGLYAGYLNTVTITSTFSDGSSQTDTVMVQTAAFTSTCGHSNPTFIQPRTNATLSYDFIVLKGTCGPDQAPVVIDTDGWVRWVAPASGSLSTIFWDNGFFTSSKPAGTTTRTTFSRLELDGTVTLVKDYRPIGLVSSGHHNIDPGREGLLLEVDTTSQTESVIFEVDTSGNILRRWDFADIISAAMTAGGDDPSLFVKAAPNDWFHNNAATYRPSDNSLIVSSRENFVICVDYDTKTIKWILGDPTKYWYQFPSLRQYALSLSPGTLPPIGQHAVSISYDDELLLFDNGKSSLNHTPTGVDRTYSAPRKYHIDSQTMVATELWNYIPNPTIYSDFCSSVYEDSPLNYFVLYSKTSELLGLTPSGEKVFHYRYPTAGCGTAFNASPIHWEDLRFGLPSPTPTPTPTPATVSLSVSPRSIGKAGTANFTVSVPTNISHPIVVNYSMSGNAVLGTDYILSGFANQITIPSGQSSATVTLAVITSKTKGREKAIMTLTPGSGYNFPSGRRGRRVKPPTATVRIQNR